MAEKSAEQLAFEEQLAILNKFGYKMSEKKIGGFRGFYNGGEYCAFKEVKKTPYTWGGYYNTYTDKVGFCTSGSMYCCGKMEIGHFYCEDGNSFDNDEANYSSVPKEVWGALFNILKLVEKDNGYGQATTLATKGYKTIEAGLRIAKFRKIKTVKSKHGRGRYDINIWEWKTK